MLNTSFRGSFNLKLSQFKPCLSLIVVAAGLTVFSTAFAQENLTYAQKIQQMFAETSAQAKAQIDQKYPAPANPAIPASAPLSPGKNSEKNTAGNNGSRGWQPPAQGWEQPAGWQPPPPSTTPAPPKNTTVPHHTPPNYSGIQTQPLPAPQSPQKSYNIYLPPSEQQGANNNAARP